MTFGILQCSIGMKIRAHKHLSRALGIIVSKKFGHSPISHKVTRNTVQNSSKIEDKLVLLLLLKCLILTLQQFLSDF